MFHFGLKSHPLFGCYHPPLPRNDRSCGVVLCPPFAREYIRSYRALRQLAIGLTRSGFHVLRFDFFGCGDSGGDCEDGSVGQWLQDISTAIENINEKCGRENVCLIGLRLGASLAAIASAERNDVAALVMWDPVVNGESYIEEITGLHSEKLRSQTGSIRRKESIAKPTEVLGFAVTNEMRAAIEKIELVNLPCKPADDLFLIESQEPQMLQDNCDRKFREHLEGLGARLETRLFAGQPIWKEGPDQEFVPVQHLQAIDAFLCDVCD